MVWGNHRRSGSKLKERGGKPMGCKPWLKVGTLLVGSLLLYGCQDTSLRSNSTTRIPDPQFPKTNTGPGAGPGNVSGGWGQSGTGFNNTNNFNNPSTPPQINSGGL